MRTLDAKRSGGEASSSGEAPLIASAETIKARQRNDRRAFFSALVIWVMAGTTLPVSIASPQAWLVIGLGLQILICVPYKLRLKRAVPLGFVALLSSAWTGVALAAGMEGQGSGLAGTLLRILIVLIPVVSLKRLPQGLVNSMIWICYIALPIFIVRQVTIHLGFDIANLFDGFYKLTGLPQDRTILLFNFDIPEEAGRNCGPFREPGMFAANLVVASLLMLSRANDMDKKARRQKALLLGLAILTTKSTMGLATVPLLAILSLPFFVRHQGVRFLVVPIALAFVAGLIVVFGGEHLSKVEKQIENTGDRNTSWYNTRFGNAYIDYVAIRARPFLGYGYSEEGRPIDFRIVKGNQMGIFEEGDSLGLGNGLTGTVVKFGIFFSTALYLLFLWRLVRLFRSWTLGIVGWITTGLILFGQQLLLVPTLYVLLGSYEVERRRTRNATPPHSGSISV